MRKLHYFTIIPLFIYSIQSSAEVTNKSAAGFSIEINVETDTQVDKAYQQFQNISDW